jgi:hypothetical protein
LWDNYLDDNHSRKSAEAFVSDWAKQLAKEMINATVAVEQTGDEEQANN